MSLLEMMRGFTIRTRMMGAIGVVMVLLGCWGRRDAGHVPHPGHESGVSEQRLCQSGHMAQLRTELGGIRSSEKDMVIQYEKPEEVRKAYQQWVMFIDKSKATLGKFVTDQNAQDAQLTKSIIGHIDAIESCSSPLRASWKPVAMTGHHGQPHERQGPGRSHGGRQAAGAAGQAVARSRPMHWPQPSATWPTRHAGCLWRP
jgi:hypothetical protein